MTNREFQDRLDDSEAERDPFEQFRRWLGDAVDAGLREPNAMTLASASAEGIPAARMILLKAFDAAGFVFTSNYASRKGQELAANPWGSLLFYWHPLDRQVRIVGRIDRTTPEESDALFHGRPLGSRLAAWASEQSAVIAGREVLDQRLREGQRRFGQEIPRPQAWGGYRLSPDGFEFWQGRPHRLHDRLRYTRERHGVWRIDRLAP